MWKPVINWSIYFSTLFCPGLTSIKLKNLYLCCFGFDFLICIDVLLSMSDTFQFSSLKSAEIIFFNYSLTNCYIFMSFNNCDHMYLKSLCHSCKCKAVCKSYIRFFLTLNVIISMFIIYSNKCICTSVLFVLLPD